MPGLQEWIHKLEEGGGTRVVKVVAALLGLIALAVAYNFREFRGFSTIEAMDYAQVARNVSKGAGFTTSFVRPLSIHLIETRHSDTNSLKGSHPDLANPPVYPFLLSTVLKILPARYEITDLRDFRRYQPEVLIGWFNELILVTLIILVFWLARRLFDPAIAWIAALVCAGTDLFWRFSGSGLPTILLMLIFLLLCAVLAALEEAARGTQRSRKFFLLLSLIAGVLTALGALTSYGFGWLIIPVLIFLRLALQKHRYLAVIAALLAFLAVISPWLIRNYSISGRCFGTAGYALFQDTFRFTGTRLERSLDLDLTVKPVGFDELLRKFMVNLADLVENELPRLGANWIVAFFLIGLFIPFQRPGLARLRYFLLGSVAVLLIVQALGRTHLTTDSPIINTENYLVVLAPIIFIFGAGVLGLLLEQLPGVGWRNPALAFVVVLLSAPLIFQLLPPRQPPVVYPPYYPPVIQSTSQWMRPDETTMTDMPWAVAWYGDRQALWLTLNADKDFFQIHDFQKPVQGLYLTSFTLDARFFTQMLEGDALGFRKMVEEGATSWEGLALVSLAREQVPKGFPFKYAAPRYFGDQLFLTDRERWKKLRY